MKFISFVQLVEKKHVITRAQKLLDIAYLIIVIRTIKNYKKNKCRRYIESILSYQSADRYFFKKNSVIVLYVCNIIDSFLDFSLLGRGSFKNKGQT